jgi:hypothetical protein
MLFPESLIMPYLHFITPEDLQLKNNGVITELYAYVAIMLVILTYGMETGLFKFSSQTAEKTSVYNTNLITVISTSLAFFY